MTPEQKAIAEAMDELTNASMGAIGDDGPTLEELDKYVEDTGQCWEGNADYHTMQRAWRLLQQAVCRNQTKEED